jgi:hypothetical protein
VTAYIPLGKPLNERSTGLGNSLPICAHCGGQGSQHAPYCQAKVEETALFLVERYPAFRRLVPGAPTPEEEARQAAEEYKANVDLRRHWLAVADRCARLMSGQAPPPPAAPRPPPAEDYQPPPPSERAQAAQAVARWVSRKIMVDAVVVKHPSGRYRVVKFERAGARAVRGAVYVYSVEYVRVWFSTKIKGLEGADTFVYASVEEALTFLDLAFCVGDVAAAKSVPTRRPKASEEGD